ncbi:MAG: hypothetical protein IJE17_00960 [Clostridia bacterium]|nr:hypothetical protein [Clostridia bacterium]MDD6682039.1 hypothetical protein [Clostridiales bacterium]
MSIDIAKYVEDIIEKLAGDDQLVEKFKKDPIATIKTLLGKINLDEEALEGIAKAVKGKIDLENLKDKAEGILGGLKGILGK